MRIRPLVLCALLTSISAIASGAAAPRVQSSLQPCVISGTVADQTGRPLRARVELLDGFKEAGDQMHNRARSLIVISRRDGSFRMTVPPGDYALLASFDSLLSDDDGDGDEEDDGEMIEREKVSELRPISLAPGQVVGGVRLVLRHQLSIGGVITGMGDSRIVYVCARPVGIHDRCVFRTEAGDDGRFSLTPLPPGPMELLISNRMPWPGDPHADRDDPKLAQIYGDIKAHRPTDPADSPSREVFLDTMLSDKLEPPLRELRVSAPAGKSDLTLALPVGVRLDGQIAPAPAGPSHPLRLYLFSSRRGDAVHYLWQSMRPLGRLLLNLQPGRRMLFGRDLLRNLAGALPLDAASRAAPRLNLTSGATLSGRVLDHAGKPVATWVFLRHDGAVIDIQKTGADGSYRFPALWPGRFAVQAKVVAPALGDGGPQARGEIDLQGGQKQTLELRFVAPQRFAGRLVAAAGVLPRNDTLQGWTIVVSPIAQEDGKELNADAQGAFSFTMVGGVRICAKPEHYIYSNANDWRLIPLSEPLEFDAAPSTPAILRLALAGRVRGVVRDAAGKPLENAKISCGYDDGLESSDTGPHPNGVFMRSCVAGSAQLRIDVAGQTQLVPLSLLRGRVTYVSITL